jgi:hypothetical protein
MSIADYCGPLANRIRKKHAMRPTFQSAALESIRLRICQRRRTCKARLLIIVPFQFS